MSKVTSKLQVTLPKALATQYGIVPGDDNLGSGLRQHAAESLVLGGSGRIVGRGSPPVLAPATHVLWERRAHEDAL